MSTNATLPSPTPETYRLLQRYSEESGHKFDSHVLAKHTGMHYGTIWKKFDDAKKALGTAEGDTSTGDLSAVAKGAGKTANTSRPAKSGRAKRSKNDAGIDDHNDEDGKVESAENGTKGKATGRAKKVKTEEVAEDRVDEGA